MRPPPSCPRASGLCRVIASVVKVTRSGGFGAVDPPVPVPITVVKRRCTYNTARSTRVGRSAAARTGSFFINEDTTDATKAPLCGEPYSLLLCQGSACEAFTTGVFFDILGVPESPGMRKRLGLWYIGNPSGLPNPPSRGPKGESWISTIGEVTHPTARRMCSP